mgnify:CR=1 FL=1
MGSFCFLRAVVVVGCGRLSLINTGADFRALILSLLGHADRLTRGRGSQELRLLLLLGVMVLLDEVHRVFVLVGVSRVNSGLELAFRHGLSRRLAQVVRGRLWVVISAVHHHLVAHSSLHTPTRVVPLSKAGLGTAGRGHLLDLTPVLEVLDVVLVKVLFVNQ